jgi:hypothetical protein
MTTRATARVTPGPQRSAPRPVPRTAPRSPRPELRLVTGTPVPRARRGAAALRNRRAPFVLLVVGLLVATTLGLLVLNTAIAVDSLKATRLKAANAEREQQVQRLQQQVVTASTPAEVARAAVAAGLVPAGPAAYLVIQPDGSSVVRGTGEPAGATADTEGGD